MYIGHIQLKADAQLAIQVTFILICTVSIASWQQKISIGTVLFSRVMTYFLPQEADLGI
jgi:hypothetical protein